MIVKYNSVGHRSIVYCILDNLKECNSLIAKDMSINSIDFIIRGLVNNRYDIVIGADESELLLSVARVNKFSHAVVVTT
jgi:hypothetical protein